MTDMTGQSAVDRGSGDPAPGDPVVIDCDDCAVRGPGCRDCVVSVLLGVPDTLLHDERAALEVSVTSASPFSTMI